MGSIPDPTGLLNKPEPIRHYNEEDVKAEAIWILEQAISWVKGEGEKPQTNNLDAVCRIVRALELCGIS
jgi:hypothetical protein